MRDVRRLAAPMIVLAAGCGTPAPPPQPPRSEPGLAPGCGPQCPDLTDPVAHPPPGIAPPPYEAPRRRNDDRSDPSYWFQWPEGNPKLDVCRGVASKMRITAVWARYEGRTVLELRLPKGPELRDPFPTGQLMGEEGDATLVGPIQEFDNPTVVRFAPKENARSLTVSLGTRCAEGYGYVVVKIDLASSHAIGAPAPLQVLDAPDRPRGASSPPIERRRGEPPAPRPT